MDMGLNGELPSDVNLPELQTFNISDNPGINGYIPAWISSLDNLTNLDLSGCGFGSEECYPMHMLDICNNSNLTAYIDDLTSYMWMEFCNSNGTDGGCPEPTGCQQTDREALIQLYNATNGTEWETPWDLNLPMEEWEGVYLNDNGCVEWLNLRNNNLSGTLPDLDLPYLTSLYLGGNNLISPIPSFENMPDLSDLELDNNDFTGNVPTFDNLPLLWRLNLSYNNLTGTIPDFDSLTNLKRLHLNDNQLKGPIPYFDSLYNLEQLYLQNNNLTDTIPNFPTLTNLTNLAIDHNQLSGAIPDFCLLYTSPSPRDLSTSRMPSSA